MLCGHSLCLTLVARRGVPTWTRLRLLGPEGRPECEWSRGMSDGGRGMTGHQLGVVIHSRHLEHHAGPRQVRHGLGGPPQGLDHLEAIQISQTVNCYCQGNVMSIIWT